VLWFGAFVLLCLVAWCAGASAQPLWAQAAIDQTTAEQSTIPLPTWLEPRGVNIADLVGVVPDDHLRGAILSYANGVGLLQYEWGVRTGDDVWIRARVLPNYGYHDDRYTAMGCLGQPAYYDQMPSTAPASRMRLFSGAQEITHLINYLAYTPAGLTQPTFGAGPHNRYVLGPSVWVSPGSEPLNIPANKGCFIAIPGIQSNLYAEFQMVAPQKIVTQHMQTRTCTAHSYIGYLDPESESPLEATGVLAPLARQMALRFGNRHDKCPLMSPTGANFILVNFPPTPFDPYIADPLLSDGDPNFNIPGSGTYRLEARYGGLSVDHVASFAMPLRGQWQDADQVREDNNEGRIFLPHFTDLVHLASPEYFIPPNFSWNGSHFDPCMVRGGCPDALLDALYNATYSFDVHFYRFDRTESAALHRIPVKQVGVDWTPANGDPSPTAWMDALRPALDDQQPISIFVPLVGNNASFGPIYPTEDGAGCPCGWFDDEGRMYDYIPDPDPDQT